MISGLYVRPLEDRICSNEHLLTIAPDNQDFLKTAAASAVANFLATKTTEPIIARSTAAMVVSAADFSASFQNY